MFPFQSSNANYTKNIWFIKKKRLKSYEFYLNHISPWFLAAKELFEHAISDYLIRNSDFFSLRLSNILKDSGRPVRMFCLESSTIYLSLCHRILIITLCVLRNEKGRKSQIYVMKLENLLSTYNDPLFQASNTWRYLKRRIVARRLFRLARALVPVPGPLVSVPAICLIIRCIIHYTRSRARLAIRINRCWSRLSHELTSLVC